MTTKDDGGPAFPTLDHNGQTLVLREWGMTLRDYAAIHGPGMDAEASLEYGKVFNPDPYPGVDDLLGRAEWWAKAEWTFRYMQADAMLAARGGK